MLQSACVAKRTYCKVQVLQSAKNKVASNQNWHERAVFQSVVGRAVDWQQRQWPQRHSFPFFFLRRDLFSQNRIGSKTYLAKVTQNAQKPRDKHFSRPRRPFWGPLAAILDVAGGERVPPAPLGWYYILHFPFYPLHLAYFINLPNLNLTNL